MGSVTSDSEGFAKPWLDFEKQIGQRMLLHGPIEKANEQYLGLGALLVSKLTFPPPDSSVKTEDKDIGSGLKVRIYTPPKYPGDRPVCLYFHGGGWAMGDLDGEDATCRTFSKNASLVVVSVDYRLAPAHPYPAPLDDCVTVYEWALKNSSYLKTKSNEVISSGLSAGANLALSLALKVIDSGKRNTLKGIVAIVPVTIAPEALPEHLKSKYTSYAEHAEHTVNTARAMKMFFDAYEGDGSDPYVSPLLHKRLKDLPKVYMAVAGQDTLRDDGRLFKAALDDAGVPNLYDEYPGYPHYFWQYPSEHLTEVAATYNENVKRGFEFILGSDNEGKRPIRIAGASGGFTDRQRAIHSLAQCDVDVIVGDWMSECTMSWHGAAKAAILAKGDTEERAGLFDPSFMANLIPALPLLAEKRTKLAVNAGASDTEMLAKTVEKAIADAGLTKKLKVAWIQGDEVLDVVNKLLAQGEKFENICFGGELKDWGFTPVAAQCYLGGAGIAEAFKQGADIVICGRVADAAPTIGAAMWWHEWNREKDFDQIAGSLIAGHLIECSSYVCGGYYSGFKEIFDGCENIGFPIAEVFPDGSCALIKEPGTGGEISVGTVASQLLYEIQGPQYYGSDVVAVLEGINMKQEGKDRVRVTGVKGKPPPTTTKVGITASGGYQAEFHFLLVGLDLEQKAEWTERQVRASMGKNVERFSCLKFTLNGYCPEDPRNQDVATVDFRVFAQTKDRSLVVKDTIEVPGFNRWCLENFLQSCPGATIENDIRQSAGKEFFEYWAALIPQKEISHQVQLLWDGKTIDIPPSPSMELYNTRQWSYETENPVPLSSFGPTTRCPMGFRVLGRSGDKASDANIGLFVREADEWDWLRSFLTIDKIVQLLGPEYNGKLVERFEIPGIKAVHFLLHDHLDRSYNATSTYDGLGKNVCEYLRAKYVDVPNSFLRRGRI